MLEEHEGVFKRYQIFFQLRQFYISKFPKLGKLLLLKMPRKRPVYKLKNFGEKL
jgi:hypothetical protein